MEASYALLRASFGLVRFPTACLFAISMRKEFVTLERAVYALAFI